MLKCNDVYARAGDYLDKNMGWRGRVAMWWHLVRCVYCRCYLAQMKLMISALGLRKHPATEDEVAEVMKKLDDGHHH